MLILQQAQGEREARQGCHAAVLAELQAGQGAPRAPQGLRQQRLLELARRLAKVQALGDEYVRVDFSPEVARQVPPPEVARQVPPPEVTRQVPPPTG